MTPEREELERAHQALADAQERLYWIDRMGVDLNAFFASRAGRLAFMLLSNARKLLWAFKRKRRGVPEPVRVDAPDDGPKPTVHQPAWLPNAYASVLDVAREGRVALADAPEHDEEGPLHIAVVMPSFRRGSGGHSTLFNLFTRLEQRGHTVTYWMHDFALRHRDHDPSRIRAEMRDYFRPPSGPVFKGFEDWHGADVVVATGWETVHPILRLPGTRARAYLVQDHEPEFFATSAERLWAESTYEEDLLCIGASPWLADLVRDRYGREAVAFDLGVDHDTYFPRPAQRRDDTVIFYGRDVTPRRAVPLGLLALEELRRRRPGVRLVLFGADIPVGTAFDYEHLGVATPSQLAWAYSEATVGLSLSLTNHSLIPQEMLACGLPCVEIAGGSAEAVFGAGGPVELAEPDPLALAGAIERLLDDRALREHHAAAGLQWAATRTWDHAADQVEAGLLAALRSRTAQPSQR